MALNKTPEPVSPHQMHCEAESAAEVLFVCRDEACGRRVVVGKRQPRLTVIDRGDWNIPHVGSLGGLVIDGIAAA